MDSPIDGRHLIVQLSSLIWLAQIDAIKKNRADCTNVAKMNQKPQGRGYVQLEETQDMPWECANPVQTQKESTSTNIKAHEFHYSSLEKLTLKGKFAFKVHRGVGITGDHDGWIYKNLVANYSHIRNTQRYPWAQRFVNFAKRSQRVEQAKVSITNV